MATIKRWDNVPPQRGTDPYPKVYSLVEIVYINGDRDEFTISASPAVMQTLVVNAERTGFFLLFNDDDTIAVAADKVRSIAARKLTNGN